MTEGLRAWLLALVAVSLLSGVLLSLTPEGAARRTLRFVCGLLLILTALGPVAKLDVDRLAGDLSRLRLQSDKTARAVEDGSVELMAALIKEQAEAYIWDKAAALGFTPARVEAGIETAGDYPRPRAVRIAANCTAAQRQRLTAWIERELAIPSSEQEWSGG